MLMTMMTLMTMLKVMATAMMKKGMVKGMQLKKTSPGGTILIGLRKPERSWAE